MNADTLALAVMDDDGYGCAILTDGLGAERVLTARFQGEAWINDYAVPVDAEGPETWDCTTYARQHAGYLAACARRRHENLDDGVTDNDDVFMNDPAAPEWVRSWHGPFTITVRYAKGA